jgi:hypothetical protein
VSENVGGRDVAMGGNHSPLHGRSDSVISLCKLIMLQFKVLFAVPHGTSLGDLRVGGGEERTQIVGPRADVPGVHNSAVPGFVQKPNRCHV